MKVQPMFFAFLISALLAQPSFAQNPNGWSIGYLMSQTQQDFGVGAEIGTPFYFGNAVSFRLAAQAQFFQHYDAAENATVWTPYGSYRLGANSTGLLFGETFRVYGGGGLHVIVPSSTLSDEVFLGGYGVFGAEAYVGRHFNFYFEAGATGIGAAADKLPQAPIFSNGFMTNVGFRFVL